MSATILSNIKQVYTGTGAGRDTIKEHIDIHLEAGLITAVQPHQPGIQTQAQRAVIDCSAYTVTPGLIDCHGHITILGLSGDHTDVMNGPAALLYIEKILYTSLVNGCVTTMRDIGGATDFMKRIVDQGHVIGPRLKIAVAMLSTTSGHADFRGPDRCHAELSKLWPEGPGRPSSIVDGPWECRKRVRELVGVGADLIKLCTSPGIASPSDKLENQDFSADEIEAICTEARARGLRVAAHAHSRSGIELAIRNGVNDIQHISFMDKELVDLADTHNCTVTPTSWVIKALERDDSLSPAVADKAKRAAEHHAKAVEYAAAGGLRILAGTDPVLPGMHGRNFMELAALIEDGLSPTAAWHGGTGLAAKEIGVPDTGTIEVGKRADLIVASENVIDAPQRLGDGALVEVIKDGFGHRSGLTGLPQITFARGVENLWGPVFH